MMLFKKFLAVILCFVTLLVCLCACSAHTGNSTAYCQTDQFIRTLDPQLVSTKAELTVIYNCFDGLMRYDADGQIAAGAADRYTVSDDGKTYTFTLRDDLVWSDDETPVTAADFVYGLTRAVLPETKAPFASMLFSIENAEAIYSAGKSSDSLGVKAPDKQTVVITLTRPDHNFLYTLAHPVAAPCHEAFFLSTKGRYGLNDDSLLCNGAFYLSKWNTENQTVRMVRFSDYAGTDQPVLYAAQMAYGAEDETLITSIKDNEYNIYTSSYTNMLTVDNKAYTQNNFYTTTYALYISDGLQNGENDMRAALMQDVDRTSLRINLPVFLQESTGVIPADSIERGQSYRKQAGAVSFPVYDAAAAVKQLGNEKSTYTYLSGCTLYYPDNDYAKLYANQIAQTWQKDLSAYINTKAVTAEEILSGIQNETMLLAILPVQASNDTAFGTVSLLKELNVIGFQIQDQYTQPDLQSWMQILKSYEQRLIDQYTILPLFDMPDCYLSDQKITKLSFIPYGNILHFRYITKEE